MEDVGEIMRKMRTAKNHSQEFVADKLKVDYTTYSRYERGESSPKFESIVKFCELYNITLDEFQHFGEPVMNETKSSYQKVWTVPITVALDGTSDTLEKWISKLTAINAAI